MQTTAPKLTMNPLTEPDLEADSATTQFITRICTRAWHEFAARLSYGSCRFFPESNDEDTGRDGGCAGMRAVRMSHWRRHYVHGRRHRDGAPWKRPGVADQRGRQPGLHRQWRFRLRHSARQWRLLFCDRRDSALQSG